jgi:hypothetical protein
MVHSLLDRRRESDLGQDGFPHGAIERALCADPCAALSTPSPLSDFVVGSQNVQHNAAVV